MIRAVTIATMLLLSLTPAAAQDAAQGTAAQDAPPPIPQPRPDRSATASSARAASDSMCLMIEAAASANELPLEYFMRVLWRESNFRPNAVGPPTRSGARALGIAQFMPGTAGERQLLDPFDPVQALPKAAEFLRELRAEFGNLGLAAAAYNAGPRRVRDWLEGRGGLPGETRRYVEAVTGRSAEEWGAALPATGRSGSGAQRNCGELLALLRRGPSRFMDDLQMHVVASAASPWGVQLAAGFSRERVLASYSAIERQNRELLAGHDMVILRSVLRSRGTNAFYQVRIGTTSRIAANELCKRLQTIRIACMVLRNRAYNALILESVAGLEDPPDDDKAKSEEAERHGEADADVHVGDLKEAPAKAADQIDDRVEQGDGLPQRR